MKLDRQICEKLTVDYAHSMRGQQLMHVFSPDINPQKRPADLVPFRGQKASKNPLVEENKLIISRFK